MDHRRFDQKHVALGTPPFTLNIVPLDHQHVVYPRRVSPVTSLSHSMINPDTNVFLHKLISSGDWSSLSPGVSNTTPPWTRRGNRNIPCPSGLLSWTNIYTSTTNWRRKLSLPLHSGSKTQHFSMTGYGRESTDCDHPSRMIATVRQLCDHDATYTTLFSSSVYCRMVLMSYVLPPILWSQEC